MNRIINKLRNPIIATVLMLSIVLIPIFSSPFTEVHAEDIYQAYTKSGEYPASDHLKNPSTLDRMDQMLKVMLRTALMIIDHFQIAHFHLEKLYIQRNLEQLQSLKNLSDY